MKNIVKIIICLCMATNAFAGLIEVTTPQVSRVFAGYEDNAAFFRAKGTFDSTPANCTAGVLSDERTFAVSPALSNVDHVLSILLAAQMAEKQLNIQYYDDRCYLGHLVIRRIAVY